MNKRHVAPAQDGKTPRQRARDAFRRYNEQQQSAQSVAYAIAARRRVESMVSADGRRLYTLAGREQLWPSRVHAEGCSWAGFECSDGTRVWCGHRLGRWEIRRQRPGRRP